MKVSIITATFNSAKTIANALKSVQQQSYPHVEHIIIDGKSSDETMQIVHSFRHIQKKISEKDTGIYDAMNKGIALADGEIIGILNSDDFYPDEYVLQKVVAAFEKHNCDAVYGDLLYVDENNSNKIKRRWISGGYSQKSFLYGWMPPHPAFFVRKHCYQQLGNFNLNLGSAADYELMLRMMVKHQIKTVYLPEILVHMRSGGVSNKNIQNRLAANKNDRLAWKINGLQPFWFTLFLKPLRKLNQFIP
jgi:glycosyltransferase involved in cell wall biosynthesis